MSSSVIAHEIYYQLRRVHSSSKHSFQEILEHYVIERFLARFSQSSYREQFVLKGAFLLKVLNQDEARPTRDIDILGFFKNEVSFAIKMVKEVCQEIHIEDGVCFEENSIQGEPIKLEAEYPGVRIKFQGFLHTARVLLQLDIGFGDIVVPEPKTVWFQSPIGLPSFSLKGYPKETVVAEKYQILTTLDLFNSRLKDFYDIYQLARLHDFEGKVLSESILATFSRRNTALTREPIAFQEIFFQNEMKKVQWVAFLKRLPLSERNLSLLDCILFLRSFLLPVTASILQGNPFSLFWKPGGPWV